jgi:hypothetical protein
MYLHIHRYVYIFIYIHKYAYMNIQSSHGSYANVEDIKKRECLATQLRQLTVEDIYVYI